MAPRDLVANFEELGKKSKIEDKHFVRHPNLDTLMVYHYAQNLPILSKDEKDVRGSSFGIYQ